MAKYKIDASGVTALKKLASDLTSINNNIESCGQTLKNSINAKSDELGLYADQIIEVVDKINKAQEKGRESATTLAKYANKMASDVEVLIAAGLTGVL